MLHQLARPPRSCVHSRLVLVTSGAKSSPSGIASSAWRNACVLCAIVRSARLCSVPLRFHRAAACTRATIESVSIGAGSMSSMAAIRSSIGEARLANEAWDARLTHEACETMLAAEACETSAGVGTGTVGAIDGCSGRILSIRCIVRLRSVSWLHEVSADPQSAES